MSFTVYFLRSLKDGKIYIGHTSDLDKRLVEHNGGRNRWANAHRPWCVVHREKFETRGEAMKREKYLRSRGGIVEKKRILESLAAENAQLAERP